MYRLKKRFKNEKGQGLVEYGLILALVSIVAILVLSMLGGSIKGQFEDITGLMGGSNGSNGGNGGSQHVGISTDADYTAWAPLEALPIVDITPFLANDGDFTGDNASGFRYKGSATTVTIPKTIGGELVTNYSGLFSETSVDTVYAEDSSAVTTMEGMFSKSKAETLFINQMDTSNVENMEKMFADSQVTVTSFTFGDLDTRNVTNMEYMFTNHKINEIDLRRMDTSNVETMDGMFDTISSESHPFRLNVTSFDTRNAKDMARMFRYSGVVELDVRNFRSDNATDTAAMFLGINVPMLDLSHFVLRPNIDMGSMFTSAKIDTLDLSGLDFDNFTTHEWKTNSVDLQMFGTEVIQNAYVKTDAEAVLLNIRSDFGKGEGYVFKGLPSGSK